MKILFILIILLLFNITGCVLLSSEKKMLKDVIETVVSSPNQLTLEESLSLALKNNSDIQFAYQNLLKAEAKYKEESAKFKPALRAEANYIKSQGPTSEVLDFNEAKIALTQPIFTGGRIFGSIKQAEANLTIAQQDYEKAKQDIVFEAKKSYYEILKTKKIREVAVETIKQLEAHLEQVKKRYEAGSAIKLDVMQTEAELSKAKQDLLKAENAVTLAKINFNKLLGRDLQTEVEVADILNLPQFQLEDLNEYLNEAFANRPEIKKEKAELSASQMDVSIAKSQRFPQIELKGSYGYSGRDISSLDRDWRGIASVNLPIWDWGEARNKIKQAQAGLEQKKIIIKKEKDDIIGEVIKAYFTLKEFLEELNVSAKFIRTTEETLRVVKLLYDEGKVTNTEVLDAQVKLKRAKTDYHQSLYNYALAIAGFKRSIGGE